MRIWNAESGEEIGPRMYRLKSPRGAASWATIDHVRDRVVGMGEDGWRNVGWVGPAEGTGLPEWLPVETFRPV